MQKKWLLWVSDARNAANVVEKFINGMIVKTGHSSQLSEEFLEKLPKIRLCDSRGIILSFHIRPYGSKGHRPSAVYGTAQVESRNVLF